MPAINCNPPRQRPDVFGLGKKSHPQPTTTSGPHRSLRATRRDRRWQCAPGGPARARRAGGASACVAALPAPLRLLQLRRSRLMEARPSLSRLRGAATWQHTSGRRSPGAPAATDRRQHGAHAQPAGGAASWTARPRAGRPPVRSAGRPPSKRRFIARAARSLVRFGRRTALHGTMGTTVLALARTRRGLNAGSALGERESREALGRRRALAARGAHGRPGGVRAHATRARAWRASRARASDTEARCGETGRRGGKARAHREQRSRRSADRDRRPAPRAAVAPERRPRQHPGGRPVVAGSRAATPSSTARGARRPLR